MDRFDSDYQSTRRPNNSSKFFLKRLLVVVVIFAAIVVGWSIIHPLAPGSVSISISAPTQFAAGAPEKIKVTMNSEHGYPAWDSVDWGDGFRDSNQRPSGFHSDPCGQYYVPTDGSTPPPVPHVNVGTLPPEQGYIELLHRYRRPGNYLVTVHADEFGYVCTNQRAPSGYAQIDLHVTGPVAPGNGLSDPRPGFGLKLWDYYGRLSGYFGADDSDGYIRSMTVTWIDGTTHLYNNYFPCVDRGNTWPRNVMGFQWRKPVKTGIYTVKVTALSTDCNGSERQTTTLVVRFRLGPARNKIQMLDSTFLPHDPNGNRDPGLPVSELWDVQNSPLGNLSGDL